MINKILKPALLASLCVSFASAGLISHNGTPDNTVTTSIVGVTGFATFGDAMAGMVIGATFGDGDSATCIWAAGAAGSGGCSGIGTTATNTFSLNLTGDSFNSNWVLSAGGRLVSSLTINSLAGSTVFDIVPTSPANSTPGSAEGAAVNGTTVGNFNGVGAYSNRIQIGVNPAVGDLYGLLTITFNGPVGSASFIADTDSVGLPGGVPEPSSIALLLGGLGILAWKRRRG